MWRTNIYTHTVLKYRYIIPFWTCWTWTTLCVYLSLSCTVTASQIVLCQTFQISNRVLHQPCKGGWPYLSWWGITTVSVGVWEQNVDRSSKINSLSDYHCHRLPPCVTGRVWDCSSWKHTNQTLAVIARNWEYALCWQWQFIRYTCSKFYLLEHLLCCRGNFWWLWCYATLRAIFHILYTPFISMSPSTTALQMTIYNSLKRSAW